MPGIAIKGVWAVKRHRSFAVYVQLCLRIKQVTDEAKTPSKTPMPCEHLSTFPRSVRYRGNI